jgi:hypothetical protein
MVTVLMLPVAAFRWALLAFARPVVVIYVSPNEILPFVFISCQGRPQTTESLQLSPISKRVVGLRIQYEAIERSKSMAELKNKPWIRAN